MRQLLILSAVAVGWLGLTAAPAGAAKGVKKVKPANTAQHVSGIVTKVQAPAMKGGAGSFTVAAAGSKKKGKPAANGGKAGVQSHVFTTTPTTTFRVTQSGRSAVVAAGALKVGEHVSVQANSDQAQSVSIQMHAVKKKKTRSVRVIAVPRKIR